MSKYTDEHALRYEPDGVTVSSRTAAMMREIYAPLCAADAGGVKSSITPFLSGDIKIDKQHYLTKPVSRLDLRVPLRNFFVRTDGGDVFALTDRESGAAAEVRVGQLWQRLINCSQQLGLEMESLHFVPVNGADVEVMQVTVRNIAERPLTVAPSGCIPIFGRSLVNKHDHEHVTSLLHRTEQMDEGILVAPTMSFNEEGHQPEQAQYFVFGIEEDGTLPLGSFPTMDGFLGDAGTLERPEAVVKGRPPVRLEAGELNGREIAGALCFNRRSLAPGEAYSYIFLVGQASSREHALEIYRGLCNRDLVQQALRESERFWRQKSGSIVLETADARFDSWSRWVMIQPVLRRIYGCSFLPDHDYGKGGKGWRDLWQDLLSLILIEPETVRQSLVDNFGGVRVDGSNATIIGTGRGEFIADRNAITRVWMDHGAWPVLTILLYIHQTGDDDILFETNTYFRDPQFSRSRRKDEAWTPQYGRHLKTAHQTVYQGSLLEHMLVQTLTQFFNVGEHNMIRLESADWNDGLDMAFERGESVAFSSFYAWNLELLADRLEYLKDVKGVRQIHVFKELMMLMDSIGDQPCDYDNAKAKRRRLFEHYYPAVEPEISGEQAEVSCDLLIADLRHKAVWLSRKIQSQELVAVDDGGQTYQWFNGYYDGQARRVEGVRDGVVRMTLTGQVFALMSGMADEDLARAVIKSVDRFLKDPVHGGHRLNTDFAVCNYLELGRAFSFAYGTKENGAVFSHMTVMYAYALYSRGFAREGFRVLDALFQMADRFSSSRIYPNIPEYFDSTGRGMYAYLTGSASWIVLTWLTRVFGVRGYNGDLVIDPQLVQEQFSSDGRAAVTSSFAGVRIRVVFCNTQRRDAGEYRIGTVRLNGQDVDVSAVPGGGVCLTREQIVSAGPEAEILVDLISKKTL